MKKLFCILLCVLLMMLGTVPFGAARISTAYMGNSCGENLQWSYNEDTETLTISGSGDMTDYDRDKNPAPWSQYYISNVVINEGLKSIGSSAFSRLSMLESISIPDGITSIGIEAFWECDSIKSINLPSSVTEFGEDAFSGCRALESFTIPQGVTTLPMGVLGACHSLKEINIPSSVTSIDIRAFSGSVNINKITVDSENPVFDSRNNCNAVVETATDTLYIGCDSTVIDSTLTSIGEEAFNVGFGPSDVTIPGNIKTIGEGAFSGNRITSLTIEEGVETIEAFAFTMNEGIRTVTLPKSVKYIGNAAFAISAETFVILNPDCEIYDHPYTLPRPTIVTTSTIYGFEGSTAQMYAQKYNRDFEIYVPTEYECGDVDMDGVLSILDATKIQRHLASLDTLTDEQKDLADIDNDTKISIMDATKIQRILAMLE